MYVHTYVCMNIIYVGFYCAFQNWFCFKRRGRKADERRHLRLAVTCYEAGLAGLMDLVNKGVLTPRWNLVPGHLVLFTRCKWTYTYIHAYKWKWTLMHFSKKNQTGGGDWRTDRVIGKFDFQQGSWGMFYSAYFYLQFAYIHVYKYLHTHLSNFIYLNLFISILIYYFIYISISIN